MTTPTREEVLAEPAGRRLDGWVGVFVLGWVPAEGYLLAPVDAAALAGGTDPDTLPAFSTDIAAAWHVVEAQVRSGLTAEVLWNPGEGRWNACVGDGGPGTEKSWWRIAPGATAPEAICKAALLAVLAETPPP